MPRRSMKGIVPKDKWGAHLGKPVRSAHSGYDCYLTGKVSDNGDGQVRCVLRSPRLPSHITQDIVAILPVEMWWPRRDPHEAHAMIDCVLNFQINQLASWKSLFPNHTFGYEMYMKLLEHRLAQQRPAVVNAVKDAQARTGPGITMSLPKPALFPCEVVEVEKVGSTEYPRYAAQLDIARFKDGMAALRVTLTSPPLLAGKRLRLSRVYVDLEDGRYDIIEHYPGRYKALGLSPQTLLTFIGVKRPSMALRKRMIPRPPLKLPDPLEERSKRVQEAISEEAEPRQRRVDPFADIDVNVFPDAPAKPR